MLYNKHVGLQTYIGYEPAGLTVQSPPPLKKECSRVG